MFTRLGFTILLATAACEHQRAETASPDEGTSQADPAAGDDGRQQSEAAAATDPSSAGMTGQGQGMMHACPMQVPNTKATAVETEQGIALEFETDEANQEELRRRVRKMADMHTKRHGPAAVMPEGDDATVSGPKKHGHGPMHGGMKVVPSTATARDTETGARLSFEPTDSGDLEALRKHVHDMATKMSEGRCPMHEQMKGHRGPPASGGGQG